MRLKVIELDEGLRIEGPTGEIGLDLEPTDGHHTVNIEPPGTGSGKDMCEVTGNTYPHKEKIKKLPYGKGGTKFNGENWEVNVNMATELCAVLKIAAVDVDIHAKAVVENSKWDYLRKSIDIGDEGSDDGELRLMAGPESPMEGVSRSWAEDAAETGNFESAEVFAEKFGLDIIDDEDAEERIEDNGGEISDDMFSTE